MWLVDWRNYEPRMQNSHLYRKHAISSIRTQTSVFGTYINIVFAADDFSWSARMYPCLGIGIFQYYRLSLSILTDISRQAGHSWKTNWIYGLIDNFLSAVKESEGGGFDELAFDFPDGNVALEIINFANHNTLIGGHIRAATVIWEVLSKWALEWSKHSLSIFWWTTLLLSKNSIFWRCSFVFII